MTYFINFRPVPNDFKTLKRVQGDGLKVFIDVKKGGLKPFFTIHDIIIPKNILDEIWK